MKKIFIFLSLTLAALLLSGCNMRTVDELYCLPKRSEGFADLQSEIDKAMQGFEYAAPLSGEHQQTVQLADLDGDGKDEYLIFAKGSSTEKPLRIFVFTGDAEEYRLLDAIECNGTAFDQVDYVRMDWVGGVELVVGRQVSDQVVRSLSAYRLQNGKMEQILTTNYSRFMTTDLNIDGKNELFVLRPGEESTGAGVAELYSNVSGQMFRSDAVPLSAAPDRTKRIILGKLNDGLTAVFVATESDDNAIMTDVFAVVGDKLTNISMSPDSGTSVQTMRDYYVYADDIDDDGILELPALIPANNDENGSQGAQYIIRWYALNSDGTYLDKLYTYHNLAGSWYMELDAAIAPRLSVAQKGASYEFSLWDEQQEQAEKLMSLYILTGQKREEQALADNRFVVYRNESTIYAMKLEAASAAYGLTQEKMISGFHLIVQDWNTGLT